MRNLLWAGLVAVILAFATPAVAQGGPGGGGGPGAGQGGGGGAGGRDRRFPRRDDMRKERDERDRDQRRGDGPAGADNRRGENIGWGEDGTEDRIEPGDTVKDADKVTRLEAEADKLELKDKKLRKEFLKIAKGAWVKSEKEDRRYYAAWKRVKSDEEALKKEKEKHQQELTAAWKEADDKLVADTILTSEQIATFQANTEDLRKETATDKSHRQDEIRARKEKEAKERMEEWRKRQAGGGDNEEKEKKEKKEDEED